MITLEEFLAKVERGERLGTPETQPFMDAMSEEGVSSFLVGICI